MSEPGLARAIPAPLRGGWRRVSIALNGRPPAETHLVWWLQGPTRYADLRRPFDDGGQAQSLAGHTTWQEPALTWTHELDLVAAADSDTGAVSWDGDRLIERGQAQHGDETIHYVETWERLADSGGPALALRSAAGQGRLVRVGGVAVTIVDGRPDAGAFAATAWRLEGSTWRVSHTLLPGGRDLPPPPAGTDWQPGESLRLADATTSVVEECAP